ncbi:Protein of unknown function [Pyronema omphalodes CBS 100304]|uniref:Uncharacterized protein n=1 Tax=Pyronema omphalodes (strain CBS 100304) TaxID=1076935 RepID=U4LGR9_PYROM|nr:Protein of unknown function [Pyronema omphalodes CBS 100304]
MGGTRCRERVLRSPLSVVDGRRGRWWKPGRKKVEKKLEMTADELAHLTGDECGREVFWLNSLTLPALGRWSLLTRMSRSTISGPARHLLPSYIDGLVLTPTKEDLIPSPVFLVMRLQFGPSESDIGICLLYAFNQQRPSSDSLRVRYYF